MSNNPFEKGWLTALTRTARSNGYTGTFEKAEDVFSNLFYLSKEKADKTRFIPLHELRMIEKLACGLYNTAFEFDDKTDVYVEKIGPVLMCCANVRYVRYGENGEKRVLGHGFNAVPLSQVSVPGEFNPTDEQRVRYWKPQTIGGAKARALFEAGFGLEFYGDPMVLVEDTEETPVPADPNATTHIAEAIINAAEAKEEAEKETKPISDETPVKELAKEEVILPSKPKKEIETTATGLPVPQPKRGRGRPKKVVEPAAQATAPVETAPEPKAEEGSMELDKAKEVVADIGNFAGEKLGDIYEKDPRNIIFLMRNSTIELVKNAAKAIVLSDPVLAERFIA